MTTDQEERGVFLTALLGEKLPKDLYAHVWHSGDKHTDWVQDPAAAEASVSRNGRHDVYISVALAATKGETFTRLKIEDAAGLLALVADIDIADPTSHKRQNLPSNEDLALALLDEMEVPPTFIIHSGHGIQAWWVFLVPWRFQNGERRLAAELSAKWQAKINSLAAQKGWKLDNVGDLARVMRVPGTLNAKNRAAIVPTRLLRYSPEARYEPLALLKLREADSYVAPNSKEHPDDSSLATRRFNRKHPCPICKGYEELPTGIGERCWGFLSQHGDVAFCTREEYAGDLPPITTQLGTIVYAHKLPVVRRLVLTPVSALEAQRITWLFDGYIPAGELSALAGAGGAGKTSAALSVAVAKAGGLPLPNGADADVTKPMGVIYLTTENHPNKVLRPRLEAEALRQTEGDRAKTQEILDRIFVVKGVVTLPNGLAMGEELQEVAAQPEALVLPRDVEALRESIRAEHVGLLIIDPVISFSERDLDVLNPADMRALLDPLAVLAQEEDIAIWVLVHFSKAVNTTVIMRISLSRQLTDTARAVGVVLEDPNESGRRWLAFAKGNLGVDPPAYSFAMELVEHPTFRNATSAVVEWGESRSGKADKLEHDLAAEMERENAKDPFNPRLAKAMQSRSPMKYEAVMALSKKLIELRASGAMVVTSRQLQEWQDELGFNTGPWSKARQILHIKTAKTGKGDASWEQRLDDPALEWLIRRFPTPPEKE